jgi:hypothetical protein
MVFYNSSIFSMVLGKITQENMYVLLSYSDKTTGEITHGFVHRPYSKIPYKKKNMYYSHLKITRLV